MKHLQDPRSEHPDPAAAAMPLATLYKHVVEQDASLQAWSYFASLDALSTQTAGKEPLAGVVFGVKDVIDVAGMPTGCGSKAADPRAAAFDAACVSQLRHAGAIPLGKTVTTEYAFRAPGPTRNPHNPEHTPGGSSSGSAAAVAAGMVPFALGTQTGGSIIRPAAFCGVIGFKPSFDSLQNAGLKQTCGSLDTIGWFAHDMALTQTVADVLLPYPPLPKEARPMKKAALILDSCNHPLEDDARQALAAACDRLRAYGVEILEISEFSHADELARLHSVIMEFEIARNLQPVADVNAGKLSQSTLDTITRGLQVTRADYTAARHAQLRLRHDWNAIVGADIDVVITPSAPGAAPAGLASTGSSVFNRPWSLLGWPCLHLPTTRNAQGLPLGVQLVANYEHDHWLLNTASGWHSLLAKD